MIVITLSFAATPALNQTIPVNGYVVQHFTDENGLPQNSINDLLFDNDGYLWLASQVGLVRFNGSSFKLYYPDDKPAMESNITFLGKDNKRCIYFQTLDRHLYCYGSKNNRFVSPLNNVRQPLLLNVHKQLFDFTGFLDPLRDTAQRTRRQSIFRELSDHNENFYVSDTDHVYLRYHDSLFYYDGSRLLPLFPQVRIPAQCFVVDKRLYILRRDSILGVYEGDRNISGPARIDGDLRKAAPGAIPATAEYRIFSCGSSIHMLTNNRLYRLYPDTNRHLRSTFLIDLDFIPNISAVEYNAGLDLLLVATLTEGFYFLRKDHFQIDGWSATLKQKMSGRLFGPLALYQDREILTDKFVFTPDGRFFATKSSAAGWRQCLYLDRQDQVWGDIDSQPVKMKSDLTPVATWPPLDADIVDYKEDVDGSLFCLTRQSLWHADSQPGDAPTFRRLYTTDLLPDKGENQVMAFIAPNRLWIGNTNGLIDYDPEKNEAHPIASFSGMHIRAIQVCRDGSVLIGTYGAGYYYYVRGHFYRMPLDKNGFLVTAHCFLEDRKGYIWIPCNKGLFRVPKADMDAWVRGETSQLFYYYYGRQDGLLTNEFNGGFNASGIITKNDFAALLSMKGIVCFYTDSLSTDFPQGSIDMSDLEIDGKPAPRTDTINLEAGYNSLNLEVSCPYLGNRNNLYLQYNLKGLNDEWKNVPEDGTLNLSRLSPGRYTLMVRKVNGFGKNNFQYRQWSIIIPPNFYRTTGFLVAMGLALLTLLLLLAQVSVKLIEKKKEVRVKAEKLSGTIQRLEDTVSKLQLSEQALVKTSRQREKLISLVIHDLRSPLRFLTMLATDLYDNQGGLAPAELKDRTWWIKKGAQDIYHFSEDFLLWVTSQKDNFKLTKQLFPIQPLLREIYDFYLEQVLQKGNRIEYDAEEDLQIFSDPHLLITIIRNLTDNANKYTDHGFIRIEAKKDANGWLITVSDTGRGMNQLQVEAFLGQGSLDNVRSGSQLGHKFVFDLTQRLDGTLTVTSTEGKGTVVSLHIPDSSG
ncbi:MAG TPA: ATP-binding protein [Puia sp.]|nr:ATP-binding protein [Puia sp.]